MRRSESEAKATTMTTASERCKAVKMAEIFCLSLLVKATANAAGLENQGSATREVRRWGKARGGTFRSEGEMTGKKKHHHHRRPLLSRNASMAVGKAAGEFSLLLSAATGIDALLALHPKPTRGEGAHGVALFTYVGRHGSWSSGRWRRKKTREVWREKKKRRGDEEKKRREKLREKKKKG